MALTYQLPSDTLQTLGPSTPVTTGPAAKVVYLVATFPKGPDYPVIVSPQDMASVFGDPGAKDSSSQGYTGPFMAYACSQQTPQLSTGGGFQYLVHRMGNTRPSYTVLDANGNACFTLQGIGAYAGSAGNNLRVSVTASGSGTDQQSLITINGTPTGGSFTITVNGVVSGPINFNATPATLATNIQTQLNAMTNVGANGTTVSALGSDQYHFALAFNHGSGAYLGATAVTLSANGASLTGGTPGQMNVQINSAVEVTFPGTVTGGTFRLTYGGVQTGDITANTSVAATTVTNIQNALNALSSVGTGNATVVSFTDAFHYLITGAGTLLNPVWGPSSWTAQDTGLTGSPHSVSTAGIVNAVRPTIQSVSIYDHSQSDTTAIQQVKDTSVGGLYNLQSVASIVGAINGLNPLTSISSQVTATAAASAQAPATTGSPGVFTGGNDGLGAGPSVVTQTALQQSLWTHADYMIVGWDAAQVSSAVLAHVATDAFNQNEYRKAILGPQLGTSYQTLSSGAYGSAGINSSRVVVVGNDNATAPTPGTGAIRQWDGFYLAAAYAGLKARSSTAETCAGTPFPLSWFTILGPSTGIQQSLLPANMLALGQQGLMVFTQPQGTTGGIYVNDAITTAPYSLDGVTKNLYYQFSVQDIDDAWSSMVVAITKTFLQRPSLLAAQQTAFISQAVLAAGGGLGNITNGINGVVTTQDPSTLAITVQSTYKSRPPITTIINQTSFTTS